MTLTCLLAVGGLVGCAPADAPPSEGQPSAVDAATDETREEVGEAFDAIADATYQKKEELERFVEQQLENAGQEVEEVRVQLRDESGEVRERWETLDARLEEQLEDARQFFGEVRSASAESWQDTKTALDQAMTSLETSLEEARRELDEKNAASAT